MDMIARREVLPPPPRKLFDLDEAPAAVEEAQKKSAGGLGKVMMGNRRVSGAGESAKIPFPQPP